MSFQEPNAYLPKDLLDSDDDVALEAASPQTSILNNILEGGDEQRTADNSSCGNNSSSENSTSIFSVQPFAQNIDPVVGWKCSQC